MITSVALCSLYFLLFVPNCQGILRYCSDQGKNYTECALMYWTGWKECTGGHGMQASECQIGFEKRQKAVCCPRNSTNETTDETFLACKINCNMTDDDFEELRVLTTTVPPTTHRVSGPSHSTTGTTSHSATQGTQTHVTTSYSATQRTRTVTVPQGGTLHSVGNGTTNADNTKSGLSTEEIAIIAAAGVAALSCLACFLIALLCKRNKRKKKVEPEEKPNINGSAPASTTAPSFVKS